MSHLLSIQVSEYNTFNSRGDGAVWSALVDALEQQNLVKQLGCTALQKSEETTVVQHAKNITHTIVTPATFAAISCIWISNEFSQVVKYLGYKGLETMNTRIITCAVGDSYNPSFATVTGSWPHPIYTRTTWGTLIKSYKCNHSFFWMTAKGGSAILI